MTSWLGGRADRAVYLTIQDEPFLVRRSWPGKNDARVYECIDVQQRVRAVTQHADGSLSLTPYGQDRKLPTLTPRGEVLVHRAGRRAVVRAGGRYIKHVRPGRAAAVVSASKTMGSLAARAGLTVPRVLEFTDASVVLSAVRGRSLLWIEDDLWEAAWCRWAEAWPRVLSAADEARGWPIHDAAAERGVITTWYDRLVSFDPEGIVASHRAVLNEARSRVLQGLDDLPGGTDHRYVPAHRDLHGGQMLYEQATDELGLLDFDTAVLGEPELDLANLDVHRQLRERQGLLTPERSRIAEKAIRRVVEHIGADPQRMEAYRQGTRLRLVGVYAFRPQWRSVTVELLNSI